jgi:hypothetical protein
VPCSYAAPVVVQLRDLLIADPSCGERLEIRSSVAGGTSGVVTNLSRVVVSGAREALAVYDRGCALRAVAATGIHDLSSRSHSVLIVEVHGVYVASALWSLTSLTFHELLKGVWCPFWGMGRGGVELSLFSEQVRWEYSLFAELRFHSIGFSRAQGVSKHRLGLGRGRMRRLWYMESWLKQGQRSLL